jgi:hypothetical protein
MQLYQGLPIITNKISRDEMKGVPHHLLGQISLDQETWTVGKFVQNALSVVWWDSGSRMMTANDPRSKRSAVEESFPFLLEGPITIPSLCYSRMP